MTLALMMLMLGFHSVCNEIHGRGQSASSKTQIACSQLKASHCSHAIGWDLRCAPVALKVTRKSKGRLPAMKPGYWSIKAGKVKINIKRHVTPLSWDAALRVCQSEGGSLVKIDTEEKETSIKKKFKIRSSFISSVNLWMGLRYFKVKRMYLWTDNTPLKYKNWGIGEPTQTWEEDDGTILREDCVALTVSLIRGIIWNDPVKPGYRWFKAGKVKVNVKRHVTPLSWDAALRVCQSEGWGLVKIDTKDHKEAAIMKKFKIKGRSLSPVYLSVGFRYFKVNHMFLWTDKTPLEYENWSTGEPSHTWKDDDGTILREGCVALAGHWFLGIYWNDRLCSI